MQDNSSLGEHEKRHKTQMRPEAMIIGLTTILLISFWIWFLLLRLPAVDPLKQDIQNRAIREILSACNAALSADDEVQNFRKEDIEINTDQPVEGVSPFVSTLGASRNGLTCRWDGVNPVLLTPAETR